MTPATLLLALAPLLQAGGATAPELDARLLVAHPGLSSGDFDAVAEDWLAAVEAHRGSPLAALALTRLREITRAGLTSRPLSPARLANLIEGLDDGAASWAARELMADALRASRFTDRPAFTEDLWFDAVRHWRVLGPWGDLDEPAPLLVDEPGSPQYRLEPEAFDPERGRILVWRTIQRPNNAASVRPSGWVQGGDQGGSGYLLAFLSAPAGGARLEVRSDGSFRAWWNLAPALEELRAMPTAGEEVHQAAVQVLPGWNVLLVEFPLREDARFTARLLDADGGILPVREWTEDAWPMLPLVLDAAPPLALELARPLATPDPWQRILDVHRLRLAGRVDRALAVTVPEADDVEPADGDDADGGDAAAPDGAERLALRRAFLLARHQALGEAFQHLPGDVRRQRLQETEDALAAAGGLPPQAALARIRRLAGEDRPADAVALARSARAAAPDCPLLAVAEAEALERLDHDGVLAARVLDAAAARWPEHALVAERRARLALDHDVGPRSRGLAVSAVRLGAGDSLFATTVRLLLQGTPEERALAGAWLERARAEAPGDRQLRELHYAQLLTQGQSGRFLDELARRAERAPWLAARWRRLGLEALSQGDEERALDALRRALAITPSDPWLRRTLVALGAPADGADAFFLAEVPPPGAVADVEPPGGASTARLLDHGAVWVLPDGGFQYRTDTVVVPLDRQGTEQLHELPAGEDPRLARVVQSDGRVFEPVWLEGSFVLPELDPGDRVETEEDRHREGTPGVPPDFGTWRFASFDEPFAWSRLVVFVPHGVPGEFRAFHFDGAHEVEETPAGVIHRFEVRDAARLPREVLMPSDDEVLPWIAFGADRTPDRRARILHRWAAWNATPPADVEAELRAWIEGMDLPDDVDERARILYDAVLDHFVEVTNQGDVTDAWTLKRGSAAVLLGAVYRLAGVPFSWAFAKSFAPDLDPEPVHAFADGSDYQVPYLVLPPTEEGGTRTWLTPVDQALGFGQVPLAQMGASALVLDGGGVFHFDRVPDDGLDDLWNTTSDVRYRLREDLSAEAEARLVVPGAQGSILRENVRQMEPAQREQLARQLAAQFIPGLDLADFAFIGLDERGAPFRIDLHGTVPNFVIAKGDVHGARLRFPELGLSQGLGPAERRWPFVFRDVLRLRNRVEIQAGDAWTLEYGPQPVEEERPGFAYRFAIEREPHRLAVERALSLRGLVLAPSEFPDFLDFLRRVEQQEKRAVRLVPALPAEAVAPTAPDGGPDEATAAGDDAPGAGPPDGDGEDG